MKKKLPETPEEKIEARFKAIETYAREIMKHHGALEVKIRRDDSERNVRLVLVEKGFRDLAQKTASEVKSLTKRTADMERDFGVLRAQYPAATPVPISSRPGFHHLGGRTVTA